MSDDVTRETRVCVSCGRRCNRPRRLAVPVCLLISRQRRAGDSSAPAISRPTVGQIDGTSTSSTKGTWGTIASGGCSARRHGEVAGRTAQTGRRSELLRSWLHSSDRRAFSARSLAASSISAVLHYGARSRYEPRRGLTSATSKASTGQSAGAAQSGQGARPGFTERSTRLRPSTPRNSSSAPCGRTPEASCFAAEPARQAAA